MARLKWFDRQINGGGKDIADYKPSTQMQQDLQALCQSNEIFEKNEYQSYAEHFRFSSGFGWDPITKQFTASDVSLGKHIFR